MAVGDVLILDSPVGIKVAEVKRCDSEYASHQEVMVDTFFGDRDPPKLVRVRFVGGGVACLRYKLVQEFQISHMELAWVKTIGDHRFRFLLRSEGAWTLRIRYVFREFGGV